MGYMRDLPLVLILLTSGIIGLGCATQAPAPSHTPVPTTTSASTIRESYEDSYAGQTEPIINEMAIVLNHYVEVQDKYFSQITELAYASSSTTRSDLEQVILEMTKETHETLKVVANHPVRWAAIHPPPEYEELHDLMLEIMKLRQEALERWLEGLGYLLVDPDKADQQIRQGDEFSNRANDLYLEALKVGAALGFQFGER